jgi:very-short-patch-repair endonuclease
MVKNINKTMINEKEIIQLYMELNKSTYEIAEQFSTYPNKIRRILKKHGVSLKTKSEAQKLALKNGRCEHPTQGKERSTEDKIKISSGLEKHWESLSERERERRSNQAKARWKLMTATQKAKMSKLATDAIRKAGKEGSKLEKFVAEKIIKSGYTVEQHKLLFPAEKLEIDLYIPELKTIIEIDGPSHFLPIWGEDKLQKQIKADVIKNGLILSRGYAIIRVMTTSTPSLAAKEGLVDVIMNNLNSIKKKFPPKTERFIEVQV